MGPKRTGRGVWLRFPLNATQYPVITCVSRVFQGFLGRVRERFRSLTPLFIANSGKPD
jgi:hypothetical protein